MLAKEGRATRLEMAHVLFMDLVGYSRLSVEEQSQRIGALQEIVRYLGDAVEECRGDRAGFYY